MAAFLRRIDLEDHLLEKRESLHQQEKQTMLRPYILRLRGAFNKNRESLVSTRTWFISSTARGGGVAEMLPRIMALMREMGMFVEWCVLDIGDKAVKEKFFALTKTIHNNIHSDGVPLDQWKYEGATSAGGAKHGPGSASSGSLAADGQAAGQATGGPAAGGKDAGAITMDSTAASPSEESSSAVSSSPGPASAAGGAGPAQATTAEDQALEDRLKEHRELFERVNNEAADAFFRDFLNPIGGADPNRDMFIVHDPQPAAMIMAIKKRFPTMMSIWRCHIGLDIQNDATKAAWAFLRPYIESYDQCVFSAPEYVPAWLAQKSSCVAPGIAPAAPKNKEMSPFEISQTLMRAGIMNSSQAHILGERGCDLIEPAFEYRAKIYTQKKKEGEAEEQEQGQAKQHRHVGVGVTASWPDLAAAALQSHAHRQMLAENLPPPVIPAASPGKPGPRRSISLVGGPAPGYVSISNLSPASTSSGTLSIDRSSPLGPQGKDRGSPLGPQGKEGKATGAAGAAEGSRRFSGSPGSASGGSGPKLGSKPAPASMPPLSRLHVRTRRLPMFSIPSPWVTPRAGPEGAIAGRRTPAGTPCQCTQCLLPEEGIAMLHRPVITQISRWDRLKGWLPLMQAFVMLKQDPDGWVRRLAVGEMPQPPRGGASAAEQIVADIAGCAGCLSPESKSSYSPERHLALLKNSILVLAGPDPRFIADDPEGRAVLQELKDTYDSLDPSIAVDIRIVELPMENPVQNALMVNAMQRASFVVVQNSLREGFGLTATEAMYKRTPFLGTEQAVGLRTQVRHGVDGVLVKGDPSNPVNVAAGLNLIMGDSLLREEVAINGQRTAVEKFLIFAQLSDWMRVILHLWQTRHRQVAQAVGATDEASNMGPLSPAPFSTATLAGGLGGGAGFQGLPLAQPGATGPAGMGLAVPPAHKELPGQCTGEAGEAEGDEALVGDALSGLAVGDKAMPDSNPTGFNAVAGLGPRQGSTGLAVSSMPAPAAGLKKHHNETLLTPSKSATPPAKYARGTAGLGVGQPASSATGLPSFEG